MFTAFILIVALVASQVEEEYFLVKCDVRQAGPYTTGPEWTPLTPEEAAQFEPGANLVERCSEPVRVPKAPPEAST